MVLLDNRELSFDYNTFSLDLISPASFEDPLKVSNYYKEEKIRLVTSENKSVKIWTYEFQDFELFLDVHIPFKKAIKSVAVAQ